MTIFMSSSTDPYQPVEYKEQITRSLLEAMTETPPDFLFVQTRSPLITRDMDLFVTFKNRLRISVTVETDDDEVRKRFTPQAPPIQARLKAIRQLKEQNLPVQIAVAPVLPFTSKFPSILADLVDRIVVDDYSGDGSKGKRSERLNVNELYSKEELENWYGQDTYQYAIERLKQSIPSNQIFISQEGFMPF